VRLWMRVLRAQERTESVAPLAEYAEKLAGTLKSEQQFQVAQKDVRLTAVAGRPAIDLRGPMGLDKQTYCRQVWVQSDPDNPAVFLVISTQGPLDKPEDVMAVSSASLATLEFFDPQAVRAKLEKALVDGQALLAKVTPEQVVAAVAPTDYWLAILQEGQMIGFAHYRETVATQERVRGVHVESEIFVRGSNGMENYSLQRMFGALDRSFEKWNRYTLVVVPQGPPMAQKETGLKQKDLLLISTQVAGQSVKNQSHPLPKPIEPIYVPQAWANALPNLVAKATPGTYAFAGYDSASGAIDMRTLTLIGPTKVVIAGQAFEATLLEIQMSSTAPISKAYFDAAGLPLKIESPDGTMLQQTTREGVLGRFQAQYDQIRQMGNE
jgi:hypothetical protein